MNKKSADHFAEVNGVRIHYLDYASDGPPMLLLHSLSANAHIFQGLIANGLAQRHRLIIPDLRGRGDSSRVLSDYSLAEEAKYLVMLLDLLELDKVILCGHSFGGLLSVFIAAHYPERIEKLIALDAAIELNPTTPFLISYATGRLLTSYPSWDTFVDMVHRAPFIDRWDASMISFLRADVVENENGTVSPKSSWIDVGYAAAHVFSIESTQWRKFFCSVEQPTLLLAAADPFIYGQYIVTEDNAIQTAALMNDCELRVVDGNHVTMLFAGGAGQIVKEIKQFTTANQRKATTAS